MNSKLAVILLLILFAVGAAGFVVFRDFSSTSGIVSIEDENADLSLSTTTDDGVSEDKPASPAGEQKDKPVVERIPDDNLLQKEAEFLVSREIMVKSDLPESTKDKFVSEIKKLGDYLVKNYTYYDGWLQLGILRKNIGDYEGAAEAWRYASTVDSYNFIAYSNLGDLYHYYFKDLESAEGALLKSIENEPNFVAGYLNLYDLYRLSYTEKADLADDALLDGFEKNSESGALAVALGSYFKEQGSNEKAKEYFEKAFALDPVLNSDTQRKAELMEGL